jgi:hypothetical protein
MRAPLEHRIYVTDFGRCADILRLYWAVELASGVLAAVGEDDAIVGAEEPSFASAIAAACVGVDVGGCAG